MWENNSGEDYYIPREVDTREAPKGHSVFGRSRSVRHLKRAKMYAGKSLLDAAERVIVDELNALHAIQNEVRKFIFTNKVTKFASEYLLRCVGEYEEQIMRMIPKNERLNERIDEFEMLLARRDVIVMSAPYACMAGKVCLVRLDRSRRRKCV